MSNSMYLEELKKLDKIELEYNNIFNNDIFLEYDDTYEKTNGLLPNKIDFKISW